MDSLKSDTAPLAAGMALTAEDGDAWARLLDQAGACGKAVAIPPRYLEHSTMDFAYTVQAAHTARVLARLGGQRIGYKVGGTTPEMLKRMGLQAPWRGPLLSARTFDSGASVPAGLFTIGIFEAEIGVRMGRDIGGPGAPPSRAELRDAIDMMFPAIEIADLRMAGGGSGAGAPAVVADLGAAGAWVRGDAFADWRSLDLAQLGVTLSRNADVVREGRGAGVLGDPLYPVELLLADLAEQGLGLRAGEFVSTGSFAMPYPMPGPGLYKADFGSFGSVSLELT